MGGTGFSPPYLNPKSPPAPFTEDVAVKMNHKVYKIPAKTAGKFLQSMSERWQKPATVFCSRDLEDGLGAFVKSEIASGVVPTDDALRAKARAILGVQETAADDVLLLEKFKGLHGIASPANLPNFTPVVNLNSNNDPSAATATGPTPDFTLPNFTDDVDMLASFDMELGAMDLTTPFGAGTSTSIGSPMGGFGLGPDGGASLMELDMSGLDVGPPSQSQGNNSRGTLGPITQSLGIRDGTNGVDEISEGALRDYAELYRVSAATASPLRRKATEKAAAKVGSARSPRVNLYAG